MAGEKTPVWLIDCDHTLYPREARLMEELDRRITRYICRELKMEWEEADRLRRDYYSRYGTTCFGLITHHGVDPAHYYREVSDLPLESFIRPDPRLAATLSALPGRRVIFSNAPRFYVDRMLGLLGVEGLFDEIATIEDFGYEGKPRLRPYRYITGRLGLDGGKGGGPVVLVDDSPLNLPPAKELGFLTVLVGEPPEGVGLDGDQPNLWVPRLAGAEGELLSLLG